MLWTLLSLITSSINPCEWQELALGGCTFHTYISRESGAMYLYQHRHQVHITSLSLPANSVVPLWHLTHDSVHAKKGMALEHDEYVVKNGNQIKINQVILVEKHKVKD